MRGWRIGRVAGIDVEINYSWLFILVMLVLGFGAEFAQKVPQVPGWQAQVAGLVAALLFFGCLLGHELAHSLAAQAYGVGVARITLFLFGGVAQTRREAPSAVAEMVIAGVGPVASLILGALLYGLGLGANYLGLNPLLGAAGLRLGVINGLLAVFNLLPAFPLDGGRILRAALWEWWGDLLRSTRVATLLGRLCGSLLIALGVYESFHAGLLSGLWYLALGWLLSGAASQSYQATRLREGLRHLPVNAALRPLHFALPADLTVLAAVHQYFMPQHATALPVAREGVLVGLLGAETIQQQPEAMWSHLRVEQLMTPLDPETMVLPLDANLGQALDAMVGGEQPHLLVVDGNGALAGVVSQEQLIAAAQAYPRRLPG